MRTRLACVALAAGLASVATAQPQCIDLGVVTDTSAVYDIPDLSFSSQPQANGILWYCFSLAGGTSASGAFFDIDLHATTATGAPDTEIGLYDSLGNLIANDDDDGHSLRSALSFGNTTPRVQTPDPFGFTNGVAANGRDGNLNGGETYYLAVGLFNTTFGATGWGVTSTATGFPEAAQVNFRTDVVPAPASLALIGLGGLVGGRRRR
ncbi:MAG: PEP-CTERM sorting domain-containing protein [Phycisphaeraceae bacterium]|nr:PEP-CTERM sorting domain-containing protein [Phycisphaeraceae bacterium]